MRILTTLSIAAASAVVLAAPAQALTIDDFSAGAQGPLGGQITSLLPAFAAAQETGPAAGLIGGEREIYVDNADGSMPGAISLRTGPPTNILNHSQDAGATGYSVTLWDGLDAGANAPGTIDNDFGLGSVDFLAAGGQLAIDVMSIDGIENVNGESVNLTMFFFTSANQWSSTTITYTDNQLGGVQQLIDFNTSVDLMAPGVGTLLLDGVSTADFLPGAGDNALSAADFTNINAVALLIDGTNAGGFDAQLDLLAIEAQVIPVPATALLIMAALGGFARSRRAAK